MMVKRLKDWLLRLEVQLPSLGHPVIADEDNNNLCLLLSKNSFILTKLLLCLVPLENNFFGPSLMNVDIKLAHNRL